MKKLLPTLFYIIVATQLSFGQEFKVGILFDQFASIRWKTDSKELQEAFKQSGVQTIVQVAHSNFNLQMKQAEQLIDSGVHALLVISVDGNRPQTFMQKAKDNGIVVIAYDRPILDDRIDLYISYDNLEIGRIQGRYIVNNIKEGNIIMVNGPVSDLNAVSYRKGQLEILAPYVKSGQIKVVQDIILDSWNEATALMSFYENSTDFTKVQGFIAAIDSFVKAAIEYTGEDESLKNIYTTGQSPDYQVVDRINSGIQNMCILKPIPPVAQKTAELTIAKIKNENILGLSKIQFKDLEVEGYLLPPLVLDKNNIDKYKELFQKQ